MDIFPAAYTEIERIATGYQRSFILCSELFHFYARRNRQENYYGRIRTQQSTLEALPQYDEA